MDSRDPALTAPTGALIPGSNRFAFGSWLFLRALAGIHLAAFISTWVQLEALIGPHGLLPATRYFSAVREQLGGPAWTQLPSLCWFFGADTFLHVLCGAGVILSLLLFAGVAPAACLFGLWTAYLSLSTAGQIFFNFQWDTLLLEATVLALLLAPWRRLPLWRLQEPRAWPACWSGGCCSASCSSPASSNSAAAIPPGATCPP